MTRNGKIARLPRAIRDELNRRLDEGEPGRRLVEWLNALPAVQTVLAADFGGRPVNEQNLSDWKLGGFEDWRRHQEARAWVAQLVEESDDLTGESGGVSLADRAAVPALVALHKTLQKADAAGDDREERRAVLGVAREITQIRRANHEAERVRIERERWERQLQEDREEKQAEAGHAARWARLKARLFPHLDEDGLPTPTLPGELQACPAANARLRQAQHPAANQGESSPIKPGYAP